MPYRAIFLPQPAKYRYYTSVGKYALTGKLHVLVLYRKVMYRFDGRFFRKYVSARATPYDGWQEWLVPVRQWNINKIPNSQFGNFILSWSVEFTLQRLAIPSKKITSMSTSFFVIYFDLLKAIRKFSMQAGKRKDTRQNILLTSAWVCTVHNPHFFIL